MAGSSCRKDISGHNSDNPCSQCNCKETLAKSLSAKDIPGIIQSLKDHIDNLIGEHIPWNDAIAGYIEFTRDNFDLGHGLGDDYRAINGPIQDYWEKQYQYTYGGSLKNSEGLYYDILKLAGKGLTFDIFNNGNKNIIRYQEIPSNERHNNGRDDGKRGGSEDGENISEYGFH